MYNDIISHWIGMDWNKQCFTSPPPTQYRLSGRRFYGSKDPTNSIKVLKEKTLQRTNLTTRCASYRDLRSRHVSAEDGSGHLLRIVLFCSEVLGCIDLRRQSLGDLQLLKVVGRRRLMLKAWSYHGVGGAGNETEWFGDLTDTFTTGKHLLDLLINLQPAAAAATHQ